MRTLSYLFLAVSALFLAMPLYAQGGATAGPNWVAITAGFSMAIASGLCGLGQAKATAASAEALGRNPAARPGIQLALFIGLAFIESLVLFTFVMIFIRTSW